MRRAIHGVVVEVDCDADDVAELVAQRLAYFAEAASMPTDVVIDISTLGRSRGGVLPPAARVVHQSSSGFVAYDDHAKELWARYGEGGLARCRPGEQRASIEVDRETPGWQWVATRPLLTLALLEALKRFDLYAVHAAAVSRADDAVVVVGGSGAGKSTTALTLLLAGWAFLGDDIVFLRSTAPRRVLAFPDEVDVTPRTLVLLPELGGVDEWPTLPGYPKHQLRPGALRGSRIVDSARVRIMVLPQVEPARSHRLEPITPDEALMELVPNVLLTGPEVSQSHLTLLGGLAAETPAYRLFAGADLGALPPLLDELLAR